MQIPCSKTFVDKSMSAWVKRFSLWLILMELVDSLSGRRPQEILVVTYFN